MKSIVLVSGGLDSCVALSWARFHLGPDILPISFAYGQRHSREIAAAQRICETYNLPEPRYINLSQAFFMVGGSSLTSGIREDNPSVETVSRPKDELPPTFVPGRNIIFLSIAGAIAYVEGAENIVSGWNAVDYSGYPDCRPAFLQQMNSALNHGLGLGGPEKHGLQIHAPLVQLTKHDIIQLGIQFGAPLHLTWSCYSGGSEPCGECDSCKIRAAGFTKLGIPDPAVGVAT